MSTISPIDPPQSLADQAFQKIATAISQGDFEPGNAIKEAQIAKQLRISRGTLREAMNRLEGRNLVERKPNLGVFVVALSRQGLVDLFNVREALEGMAARLAAPRMSKQEIDALSRLLDEHERGSDLQSGSGYYQGSADEDFHFRIVRASANKRLISSLCDELYYQIRIYRYRSSVRPGRARAAFKEHREIVKALRTRDPDIAEAAMRKHISAALANLVLPKGV